MHSNCHRHHHVRHLSDAYAWIPMLKSQLHSRQSVIHGLSGGAAPNCKSRLFPWHHMDDVFYRIRVQRGHRRRKTWEYRNGQWRPGHCMDVRMFGSQLGGCSGPMAHLRRRAFLSPSFAFASVRSVSTDVFILRTPSCEWRRMAQYEERNVWWVNMPRA